MLIHEITDPAVQALDKQVEPLREQIQNLQGRIAARTDEFKRQISQAFPGLNRHRLRIVQLRLCNRYQLYPL